MTTSKIQSTNYTYNITKHRIHSIFCKNCKAKDIVQMLWSILLIIHCKSNNFKNKYAGDQRVKANDLPNGKNKHNSRLARTVFLALTLFVAVVFLHLLTDSLSMSIGVQSCDLFRERWIWEVDGLCWGLSGKKPNAVITLPLKKSPNLINKLPIPLMFHINIQMTQDLAPYLVKSNDTYRRASSVNNVMKLHLDQVDESWPTQIANFNYDISFSDPLLFNEKGKIVGSHRCFNRNIPQLAHYYGYRKAFKTAFTSLLNLQCYKGSYFLRAILPRARGNKSIADSVHWCLPGTIDTRDEFCLKPENRCLKFTETSKI
ncbi:PC-Esterase [Dillenia turbinata]|uniref:PC-Esterase n=1 Tax=Dillenia turbinata TaxID=194707 RepID=A0AAN8V5T6_9MAGN